MNIEITTPLTAGVQLKNWRKKNRLSQLDASLGIGVSSRHLSFVENGRSKPSRELILMMCDHYDVPLRERNRILDAAGYKEVYSQQDFWGPEMAHLREVFGFVLEQHNPFAAVALDGAWDILLANKSWQNFMRFFFDGDVLPENARTNKMRFMFHPDGMSKYIKNWEELGPELVRQIRGSASDSNSEKAKALMEEISQYPTFPKITTADYMMYEPKLMVPFSIQKDDLRMNMFCVRLVFNAAKDVHLNEFRIETYLPADAETKELIQAFEKVV